MARMGADVIKVETPGGDVLREVGTGRHPGMSPIFLAANHGKRSIAIDLKAPRGRETMRRLVDGADAFVTNMRPDALQLYALVAHELPARTTAEWVAELEPLGIPAQPVLPPEAGVSVEEIAQLRAGGTLA